MCVCQLIWVIFPLSFCLFQIEKLYNSTGRELRRALFSLKQIFQVIISFSSFAGTLKITRPSDFPTFYIFYDLRHILKSPAFISMWQIPGFKHTFHFFTLALVCTHAPLDTDAALFCWVRVVLLRVCLRGSCGVFRSGHTSHSGAGLAWWAVSHRGGGLAHSQMEKRALDIDTSPEKTVYSISGFVGFQF